MHRTQYSSSSRSRLLQATGITSYITPDTYGPEPKARHALRIARRRFGQSPCAAPARRRDARHHPPAHTPRLRLAPQQCCSAWQMAVGKNKRLSKGKKGKGKKV